MGRARAGRRRRLVTTLVAASSVALMGTAAGAAPTAVPPEATAAWLQSLLTDDERMVSRDFGIDDVDLTLDVLLGLAATGSAGDTQTRVLAWFARDIAQHVGTASEATYVAVSAKGALAAMALGADPRDVGGEDLIALLAARIDDEGRVRDRGVLGDLSSTTSQALAVLALVRADVDPAVRAPASALLAASACDDGGFPTELAAAPCETSTVATALAVQALAAAGDRTEAVRAAAAALTRRLDAGTLDERAPLGWQHGLAAQALRAAGELERATALTDALVASLDGCADQASGALLDPVDPVRASVGALLASSGATLATLDGAAAARGTRPLDCTPDVDGSSGTTGEDAAADPVTAAAADATSGGAPPTRTTQVLLALALLAALALVGPFVLRRTRAQPPPS